MTSLSTGVVVILTTAMQVGMYRKVAARFAAVMKRGLASAFYEWRGLVASMRAANNRATHHFRSSWMSKYFFAWFKTAKAMHEVGRCAIVCI